MDMYGYVWICMDMYVYNYNDIFIIGFCIFLLWVHQSLKCRAPLTISRVLKMAPSM